MAVGKGSLLRAASASQTAKAPQKTKTSPEKTTAGSKVTEEFAQQKHQEDIRVTLVKTGELKRIPDQWREPGYVRPNVSMLAESISRCGILEPLPVVMTGQNTYQLVGGTRRMEVVEMLGIQQVPVYVLPGSTEEDAKKIYQELSLYAEKTQKKTQMTQQRSAGLFGTQRIPEYLL